MASLSSMSTVFINPCVHNIQQYYTIFSYIVVVKQSACDDSSLDVNALSAVPENHEDPAKKVLVVSLSMFLQCDFSRKKP